MTKHVFSAGQWAVTRGAHRARRAGVRGVKGPTRMKVGLYSTCLVTLMGRPPILRMLNPFLALVCPGSQVGCGF